MQNDGLTDGIDEKQLCAEAYLDDDIFKALISYACGDGERRRVLRVEVDFVSIFTSDAIMRLFHGSRACDFQNTLGG